MNTTKLLKNIEVLSTINQANGLSGLEVVERFGWLAYLKLRTTLRGLVEYDGIRFRLSKRGQAFLDSLNELTTLTTTAKYEPDTYLAKTSAVAFNEAAFHVYELVRDRWIWGSNQRNVPVVTGYAADEAEKYTSTLRDYSPIMSALMGDEKMEEHCPQIYLLGRGGLWY